MILYKCDKCKKIIKTEDDTVHYVSEYNNIDLCYECNKELKEWLNS